MIQVRKTFLLFSFIWFVIPIPILSKQIQFSLVPDREDILQYEIELWKTENLDSEIPFRVLANPGPINLFIPEGYEHFRIRAVAKRKVRGYWTELYQVNTFGKKPKLVEKPIVKIPVKTDVLVPIQTKEGNSELFLTAKQVTIIPTTITKKYRIKYRINQGAWQTTTSPQFNFLKDGSYRLEYKVTNELGVSDGMQVWEFKVDSTPPETRVSFLNAPYLKNGISFISPSNGILLESKDEGSGLGSIRYRTSCDGNPISEYYLWNKTTWNEIRSNCPKTLLIEISATDRLGNEEVPKQIYIQKFSQD
ncbi:hypothetical protein AB3N60_08955 [Leptospira sp. WS39.C2]